MSVIKDSVRKDILLVDDNHDNLKLLVKILTDSGFKVRASDSGRYALKSIQSDPPGLILLDVKMPGMDGYEVCRQLKADPLSANIPVIFISALKDKESKVKGFEVGGIDYITKPFHSQEILARVRTHLSMAGLQHYLEKLVHERTSKLQTERKRFQKLFELASDAFFIHDFNGTIIDVNRQACKSLGYTRGDILQLKISDIETGFSHGQKIDLFNWVVDREQHLISEGLHRRKDGSTFPVEVSLSMFEEQEPKLILAIARDITARKQAEVEQARLQRELQQAQKMEALGQLTGGIAHDFNNILGIIMGNTELALSYCVSDGQSKLTRYLERIEKSGKRAKNLVAQMMAFSRSEASGEKPLQLQPLVKGDIKMLCSTLPTSIEIQTVIEEGLPDVLMDQTQLNQILMNLCINARDAMEGKGSLTIRLGWARELDTECATCHKQLEGDWVELSATDTGSGIRPEVLKYIFDPFYTTKEVGKGTGMGMAVIHGIMRSHGGHILVETELGKGATFRLLFPPVVEETTETPGADQSTAELPQGHREQILVVDDEPDLAEFIGDLLESYGYRAMVLTSSKKALELFQEKPDEFALVITDQTMPGITGVALVKAICKVRPDIPVILNTGFSEDIDAELAARMGIRYLEKPVRAKRLIQVAGELLRQKTN